VEIIILFFITDLRNIVNNFLNFFIFITHTLDNTRNRACHPRHGMAFATSVDGSSFEERCNLFAEKGRPTLKEDMEEKCNQLLIVAKEDSLLLQSHIIKYCIFQKERINTSTNSDILVFI